MYQLDSIDRLILEELQKGLPFVEQPYLEISNKLNISEEELFNRINILKDNKYIRRLTGFFDSISLGYTSSLLAMHVDEDNIEPMAEILNQMPGCTHNYLRTHELNMWFTLSVSNEETMQKLIQQIENSGLTQRVIRFPQAEKFKIHVSFNVEAN